MQTSAAVVALLAPPGQELELYRKELSRRGAEVRQYPSVAQFHDGCPGRELSGVGVDLRCLARLSSDEQGFLGELERSFPLLRVRRGQSAEEIAGIWEGREAAGDALLEPFFARAARQGPRAVRLDARHPLVLGVLIYGSDAERDGGGTRASVSNASRGGFYVVTPDPAPGEKCLLVIPKLGDETPVPCEGRWSMPWNGSSQVLPGFGVRCVSMTSQQREALFALLDRSKSGG